MKILQVNKFNYLRGGAEKYFIAFSQKLEEEGHEVALFSMHHPKNIPSKWSPYFVSHVSFTEGGFKEKVRASFRLLYSFEAKRKFKKLLDDFKPDIVHLHNIYHQISPSILSLLKKNNIPAVMHLHDYKLICPNYSFWKNGKMLEECAAPNYYRCFIHKCFKNSYFKSLLVTIEMYLHHTIFKLYEKNIDVYISPSTFLKNVCVRFGVPAEKIKVVPNFFEPISEETKNIPSNKLLYVGRLSEEKGVDVLINALALTKNKYSLEIVGSGPRETACKQLVSTLGLGDYITFSGHLEGEQLRDAYQRSGILVIPSICLENMPFVLFEAMAHGLMPIVSQTGGLPEIIKEQENGLTFPLGRADLLAKILDSLTIESIASMATSAKKDAQMYTIDRHYPIIFSLYQQILKKQEG